MLLIQPCPQRIQKHESVRLLWGVVDGLGESGKAQMDEKCDPFRNGGPNIQVKYYLRCRDARPLVGECPKKSTVPRLQATL